MENIEIEARSFITKEQYEELKEFFHKNSQFVKEDNQETHYFDSEQDLRIQKNDFFSKIWMKKGKIHDNFREELEIKFPREDFEKLEQIFQSIGLSVKIKWFRKRLEFVWQEINVSLDYTKGYGCIIELEKLGIEEEKEKILLQLKEKFKEIGIAITPKEEFDQKFNYYKENWRTLI